MLCQNERPQAWARKANVPFSGKDKNSVSSALTKQTATHAWSPETDRGVHASAVLLITSNEIPIVRKVERKNSLVR